MSINNSAVWIEDCYKKFYISEKITDGSSLFRENGEFFRNNSKLNYIDVKCIDLSNWIKNNLTIDDYIILKLDVESSEECDSVENHGTIFTLYFQNGYWDLMDDDS